MASLCVLGWVSRRGATFAQPLAVSLLLVASAAVVGCGGETNDAGSEVTSNAEPTGSTSMEQSDPMPGTGPSMPEPSNDPMTSMPGVSTGIPTGPTMSAAGGMPNMPGPDPTMPATGPTGGSGPSAGGMGPTGGDGGAMNVAGMGTGGNMEPVTRGVFALGADVSIVLEDEYWDATYEDDGEQGDVFQILARHGFNYVRLRTFVNPSASGGYAETLEEAFCDTAHTQEAALRAKAAGLGFLLDFHYSDTWADPAQQNPPAAWAGYDIEQLETALHDYTYDTVDQLTSAGARPDVVQVGNEITGAMAGVSRNDIEDFARLLSAGIAAVHEVDPTILIMLHIERCQDIDTSRSWINAVQGQGVEFDIFAESCYGDATGQDGQALTGYHGTPADWENTFTTLAAEFPNLMFASAEYSSFKRELNDIVYNLPNGQGFGTFLWGTTRWYDTHPIEPVFTTRNAWNDFVSIPSVIGLYDQMADDYGTR